VTRFRGKGLEQRSDRCYPDSSSDQRHSAT
jgi:hypothetical protein